MLGYSLRRLAAMIPTLLGVLTLVFLVLQLIPGDPAQVILGDYATPESLRQLRQQLGLDQPLWKQYLDFLTRYARGDLGTSLLTGRPLTVELVRRLPYTLHLAAGGILIAVTVGVPAGVLGAVRRSSWVDYSVTTGAMAGIAAPSFWIGLVLIYVFAIKLGWFPVIGAGTPQDPVGLLHRLVLPSVAIGLAIAALIARLTRSSVLEILGQDYIRTARAKGLGERIVLYRHVLRNAAIPVVTIVGLNVGTLLGGAIIIETVFGRPGLGKLLIDSIYARDYPIIQGTIFVISLMFQVTNLVVDLAYAALDPRIRF